MATQDQSVAAQPGIETLLAAVAALGLAADQAALLSGALRSGFLAHCAEPVTVPDLAGRTGLDHVRVHDLCTALRALGALTTDDQARVTVSPTYRLLFFGGADRYVLDRLENSIVRQRAIGDLFTRSDNDGYRSLDADSRRRAAASVTVDPATDVARGVMGATIESIAAWRDAFTNGGRYLELGCGLAGALLTYLQLHPKVTAVGVELAADLVEVARERAAALGVADRVEFVVGDATTYADPVPFDVAFWSQFFFTRESRRDALANAFARLRPGGLLLAPVLPMGPDGTGTDPQTAIDVLLVQSWGVPALSATDLVTEVEAAGFENASVSHGPFTTVVTARRPDDPEVSTRS